MKTYETIGRYELRQQADGSWDFWVIYPNKTEQRAGYNYTEKQVGFFSKHIPRIKYADFRV